MDQSHVQQQRHGGKYTYFHSEDQKPILKHSSPDDYQFPKNSAQDYHIPPSQGRTFESGQQFVHSYFGPRRQIGPLSPTADSRSRNLSHISALSSAQPHAIPGTIHDISSEYIPPDSLKSTDNAFSIRNVKNYPVPSGAMVKPNSGSQTGAPRQSSATHADQMPSNNAAATMQALTSAIRQGLDHSKVSSRSATPKPLAETTVLRMPFQDEPGSPSSVYTEDTTMQSRNTLPLSSYNGYNPRESRPSTITEQETEDFEKCQPASDRLTPISHASTHPMIHKDGKIMSDRIPASMRPPKLNIGAVREAEARGSMTSLSDLIRRATRVASNLDRGRTASRMGYLDMFGSSEKLDRSKIRNSTYSDVLAAFPPPADGVATPNRDRPTTMWPTSAKQFMTSKSSLGQQGDETGTEKPRRRCCGLSPIAFMLMLLLLVLLIAAAVLVPVFLIVLPKQHQRTLGECSSSHPCRNEGVAIITNGQCSCVCMNGFTGSDCSREGDPECATATLHDTTISFDNATIGTAVLPILQPAASIHGVPLNITTILATFAANNLSCASENSLVVFAQSSKSRTKRLLIASEIVSSPRTSRPTSNPALKQRQDATQSSNGIVFATSSQESQPTATSISTAAAPTATGNDRKVIGSETLNFAAAVVLYVLQSNSEINTAVMAKQAMTAYFGENNPTNHTIVVAGGSQQIVVNFDSFELNFANGTRLSHR